MIGSFLKHFNFNSNFNFNFKKVKKHIVSFYFFARTSATSVLGSREASKLFIANIGVGVGVVSIKTKKS
jgi:hypothetical protein